MSVIEARVTIDGLEVWLNLPMVDESEIVEVFEELRDRADESEFEIIVDKVKKVGFGLPVVSFVIEDIDDHYFDSIELEKLNDFASRLDNEGYDPYHLAAFIECIGIEYCDEFFDYTYYGDRDSLLENIYFDYGVSDMKFLSATVDTYIDDDKVLKDLLVDGFEARNGVIILR